jgi:S-adenosylmethionine synthetase
VFVWLCSRIGDPVDQPQMASVQVQLSKGQNLGDVAEPIRQIINREFSRMAVFCEELARGKFAIC